MSDRIQLTPEYVAEIRKPYVELLEACRECLVNYSDGEYIDGRPTGNTALHLVGDIDSLLKSEASVWYSKRTIANG